MKSSTYYENPWGSKGFEGFLRHRNGSSRSVDTYAPEIVRKPCHC